MSVVQPAMFRDQLNSYAGPHHARTSSFNELLTLFKARIAAQKQQAVFAPARSPSGFPHSLYVKKRSYSDQANDQSDAKCEMPSKRSKTAPPSPPSFANTKFDTPAETKVTLPSISDALAGLAQRSPNGLGRTIVPTLSLDYFDTYKPNDENWRYGLLDSIKHSVGDETPKAKPQRPKLPLIGQLNSVRPNFDSRLKVVPTFAERKINFPYESNYTYLNKTYMNDVERYPEYLELAQLLIQLLRPQPYTAPLAYSLNPQPGFSHPKLEPDHAVLHERHVHERHVQQRAPVQQHVDRHVLHVSEPQHQHPHFHEQPRVEHRHGHNSAPHSPPMGAFSPYYSAVTSPSATRLPSLAHIAYTTPDTSFEYKPSLPTMKKDKKTSAQRTRFIPITPPSVKDKTRLELMKLPPRNTHSTHRVCISCGSDQSPCWRPSWSIKEGQLCNSCGLRYKKTAARCLNDECKKIPAKGEWSLMQTKGKTSFADGEEAYGCLECGFKVEVKR